MKLADVIKSYLELPSHDQLQVAILIASWLGVVAAFVCFVRAITAKPSTEPQLRPQSDIGHLRFPDIAEYFRGRSAVDEQLELVAEVLELPHPDTMREARQ